MVICPINSFLFDYECLGDLYLSVWSKVKTLYLLLGSCVHMSAAVVLQFGVKQLHLGEVSGSLFCYFGCQMVYV